ncbi:unnamed protein product [Colias eurytheme]|nr:unnamed protein product [Colias eurytheme]
MYNITQSPIGTQQYESNTNTTDDSVENIIKKYTRAGRKNVRNSNDNIYGAQYNSTLHNYQCANERQDQYIQNTDENIMNHNLFNFIKNYCRREIQKEIRSKLSENNVQDAIFNNRFDNQNKPSNNQKESSDKATYCRPITDLYNHDFIYKTLEKNARLTRLAKKLVAAHHKHTQNEAWNNFINELKNKHAHKKEQRRLTSNSGKIPVERSILNYDPDFSQFIDDCCRTRYKNSNASDHIHIENNDTQVNQIHNKEESNTNKYGRDQFCYSTMSLGRLNTLQKEKESVAHINTFENHSTNNIITVNEDLETYYTDKLNQSYNDQLLLNNNNSPLSYSLKNTPVHTNKNEFLSSIFTEKKDCATEIKQDLNTYKKCTNSIETCTSKQSVELTQNNMKEVSLRHVEDKLETLIDAINNFMKELKAKKKSRNRHSACINLICKECHNVKTELVKKYNDDVFDGEKYNSSDSAIPVNDINSSLEQCSNNSDITKINQIFTKHLGDDKRVNVNKTCAVQIAFEVPTRERSTEITKSLSKTWKNIDEKVEEIIVPDIDENIHNNMTIAVNTDPLSFLALLRISTEAMKRILSYMPNFDYYYYLSRLQFPQLPKSIERQFICNICGAHFKRPSDLNDHIQDHDLGETKNCCVCRQVLEKLGRTSCLFSCRYCGQCFTRAYCCELHQDTCAKRLGKVHDVASDLLLLR